MSAQVEIRTATEEDIEEIAVLERQIFSEPWSAESLKEARQREDNIFLVAVCDNRVVAYGLCYGTVDEGEIPTIATNPAYSHRGIATDLLQSLLQECRIRGIGQVFLEVRESNGKAQGLYHKCNFEIVGRRRNFYRFPTEDALVMACQVQGQQ
ncbi:MAG: ribosomal protein S18-alanine N-acetyltransferase [Lachnospiraceae bacterium]|nr:ribosomal protein S18-alanine N-acetyltransferase [Lachnospiraceae bacterium]